MEFSQMILDHNNQLYLQQKYYYEQLYNQDQYYKNLLHEKEMQKQLLIASLQDDKENKSNETKITIINDNGKLYAKKILNCPKGMKCTDINCNDYHHPNLEFKSE
jgi:hypothetical protein